MPVLREPSSLLHVPRMNEQGHAQVFSSLEKFILIFYSDKMTFFIQKRSLDVEHLFSKIGKEESNPFHRFGKLQQNLIIRGKG
jgi:hypothetical protein